MIDNPYEVACTIVDTHWPEGLPSPMVSSDSGNDSSDATIVWSRGKKGVRIDIGNAGIEYSVKRNKIYCGGREPWEDPALFPRDLYRYLTGKHKPKD